jgi:O-antigen/teichoic acid export membrane protein
MGLLSVYSMLVQSAAGVLSGLGRIDLTHGAQSAGRAATVLVSGIFLWRGWGLWGMALGTGLGALATHILCIVLARRFSNLKVGTSVSSFSLARLRELVSFGTAVLGTSLVAMLFDPLNKMVLARYGDVAGIPLYDIGFRASMFVRSLFEAGFRAIMPEISRIGAVLTEANRRRILGLVAKALKIVFTYGVGVYLLIGLSSEPLLELWLQKQYDAELLPVFRIMLLGSFVSLVGVPAYHALMARGRAYRCLVATAIPALTNVVIVAGLLIAGTRQLTPIWLAISMVIGSIGATVYLNWEYRSGRTWR